MTWQYPAGFGGSNRREPRTRSSAINKVRCGSRLGHWAFAAVKWAWFCHELMPRGICMAMELAAGFAKSVGIGPNDGSHKGAAGLIGSTIQRNGTTPAVPESDLAKVCSKVLGEGVVGRVEAYPEFNNRLKHYGSGNHAMYFDSNVNHIQGLMRRLRTDAAYTILLCLEKLYGTGNPPTLPSPVVRRRLYKT